MQYCFCNDCIINYLSKRSFKEKQKKNVMIAMKNSYFEQYFKDLRYCVFCNNTLAIINEVI